MTAGELHEAADRAAEAGDFRTADALRLLEGNERGGEVMRQWIYDNLDATEDEIEHRAVFLAVGWGATWQHLYEQAMGVLRDVVRGH
jgi:hypothetical protein